ncbi:MAG: hypothetical protein VB055_06610 [Oscillospiraceae bacterium]|nr:hypothetical protein [Oscillospiraceae bacterium]
MKRYFGALLALLVALGLTACGQKAAEPVDSQTTAAGVTTTAETTQKVSETTAAETTLAETTGNGPACAGDVINISDELPYQTDWDGDGEMETIDMVEYDYPGVVADTAYKLVLTNGSEIDEYDDLGIWNRYVYLADPDMDGVTELLVSGDAASNDYVTFCWKLTAGEPERVYFDGEIRYGDMEGPQMYVDGGFEGLGDGTQMLFGSNVNVLGTYGGFRPYQFVDGVINPVPDTIWDFVGSETEMTTLLEVKADLVGGRNGTDVTEADAVLPAGTRLCMTGTDCVDCAWFVTSDGQFGRFRIAVGSEGYGWAIDGVGENEIFGMVMPYAG